MAPVPDPADIYPLPGTKRTVFLKNVVARDGIEVGDYTYYDDPEDPGGFERNVLYHFPFEGDRLIIGKFCQIASGVTFIMNGANHRTDGFSTYPFAVFGGAWADRFEGEANFPNHGDTVIGNDVWLGYQALILPGVTIGDGAIIGARAVVTDDVDPYHVVAGNPARVIRRRFDADVVAALLEIRWWDWPIEKITANLPAIGRADLDDLRTAAGRTG